MAGALAGLVPSVTPTSSPGFVPFRSVYQVAFGTPTDGYALVHEGDHLGVARTADGGPSVGPTARGAGLRCARNSRGAVRTAPTARGRS